MIAMGLPAIILTGFGTQMVPMGIFLVFSSLAFGAGA